MTQTYNDVRNETFHTRTQIGFLPEYDSWRHEPATFTEHTLVINNHPVMEDWEESYMMTLAGIASSRGGTVLEVGFGMGISARYVQAANVAHHIIVEANSDVYQLLEQFAAASKLLVHPLYGFWQEVVPQLPAESIDGILFDTYPLTEAEIHCNHFDFFKEAHRILKPDGVLTYYSDEINDFSETHYKTLRDAGFTNIDKEICLVAPPADCQYWKSNTIVAPIIRK